MARVLPLLSWVLAVQLVNTIASSGNVTFDALPGTITPGQAATLTVEGSVPTSFAVLFSDGNVTIAATTVVPTPNETDFLLMIPSTLTGSQVQLLISTGEAAAFPIQTLSLHTLTSFSASTQSSSSSVGSVSTDSSITETSGTNDPSSSIISAATTPNQTAASLSSSTSATFTSSNGPTTSHAPSKTGSIKQSNTHLGAIVGGALGGAVAVMLILIALCIWGKYRRKRQLGNRERHATFHGDMMVKSQVGSFAAFNPFSVPPVEPASRHTRSVASSRNSSVDGTNEMTPALESYARSVSSSNSERQGDGESSLHRDSRGSETYENTRPGFGRLSPRTDRQMDIEQKIYDLKAQLIALSDGSQGSESTDSQDSQIVDIRAKIKRLENLELSDWAMELTNEVPKDF
ncbi:hypothetical protein GYMLUDRAFT_49178 [Collybiopsis luxurians FD-317 M1]|uniref:Mid2 domain-containing protein n=1 Tax=Collybiopsis luxurians FD-317 M1 TaxID=944289 RepID=A0A0D0C7I9_9AGAR|nr:hypothetical protein GYMLUDRAFT_49178 [Collybiopsis luxurians FD-317 M1]